MGDTREACLGLVDKYQDRRLADRVFDLAWTHSDVVLRQLNATEADAQLYARLASSILYANSSLRADPSVLIKNRRGQSGLWGYSISGDLPIVLLQIADSGQDRSGAPTGAGACLLAPEGPGRGPGDLERRARRLPARTPGTDLGVDCGRQGNHSGRPHRRHLRTLHRTRCPTKIAFCCKPSPASPSRIRKARSPIKSRRRRAAGNQRSAPYADPETSPRTCCRRRTAAQRSYLFEWTGRIYPRRA